MQRFLLLACAAAIVAAGMCRADELPLDARRAALDASWSRTLAGLAAKCRELQRKDLAERTEAWDLPPLLSRQRLFFPPAPGSTDALEPSDELAAFWQNRFDELRQDRAERLFELAQAAAAEHPETAFQLLHEVLREHPGHVRARQLLGYRQASGRWVRGGQLDATRMRANPRLRLPAGHWRIRTEHFEIYSEPGESQARQLAEEIEAVHAAWRQLFFSFWSDGDALARRLESGSGAVVRNERRMRVVLYKDRDSYLAALQPKEPQIGVTVGLYLPSDKTSYFFWDEDPPLGTWRHEVTHQLFSESRAVAANAGLRRNFWLLEGIAMYMESVTPAGDHCLVGGPGVDRLQFARYRQAPRTAEALGELVAMGRGDMQRSERLSELYSEAAGLCCFLMDSDNRRLRPACLEMLQRVYQDRDEPQHLFQVTGLSPAEMLSRYHAYLADVDDRDLAELGAVRNLCLKTTRATDVGLRQLDVSQLRWLDLTGRPMTDDALLAALSKASQLKQLTLEGTRVTDRLFADNGLAGRWPRLTELDLSQTQVGDDTASRLRLLQRLQVLWLTGTRVTDASVPNLLALKNLAILELGGTGLSAAAIQRLRDGLPRLERLGT